ncbi:TetR/AcrR family transcriptional regulator [Streptomyces rugosispiralis]|uniref:TetR/AcrR family transcriptional regulator n=1 Tax=Streptomyces rugosispiralis TaxID=2967341 RepID=A0ABT1UZD7_9ACTN|nr:TetR/AcrR family transcriptional regulator [Streptomyces rugosispiralis]MCQ8189900.1 TetR/AcrR family transcriptional regulator [Streptomyces rugosispiralis]
MPDAESPPRADALRNRELLIKVARHAVAELGLGVSVNEIVRRAGLGQATFYRRFASREELLSAVLGDVLDEVQDGLRRAAEADPARGLRDALRLLVEHQARHRGLFELLNDHPGAAAEAHADGQARVREQLRHIGERAQEAGAMHPDARWQDLPFLAGSLAATSSSCLGIDADDDLTDRLLGTVLAGLRAGAARA